MNAKLFTLISLFLAPLFASATNLHPTICSLPMGATEGIVLLFSGFVLLIIRVLYVKEQKDDTDFL